MRNLEFDPAAFEDLAWWIEKDRRTAMRVVRLIQELQREPFIRILACRYHYDQ